MRSPANHALLLSRRRQVAHHQRQGLHRALCFPASFILLIARAQRQYLELFRYAKEDYNALADLSPRLSGPKRNSKWPTARIVCLAGKEDSIRSFQAVLLLTLFPLVEYSVCSIGVNQEATVAAVRQWY